ncbi:ATP-dependent sacrificial sulfur transferase LarE [Desulfovibrio gilichinskyi]|uniref:Asparagine synthetase domain-containing protein n=1 Tax=Desulfovibrio gilichinskyi TaxID=1519643 RepID=A0A1X7E4Z4_9BACT|nr:ATP-dependent sacrificial sulfur transferase LarE [Desulfovibrio gilichinskyi]SMF27575.1 uncharacterized protein SAMN06295933_2649 [Desulfovibrio gilichinskyi]
MTNSHTIQTQYKSILDIISRFDKAFIAFSGGIDSSLVAKAAVDVLGTKATAVTIESELTASRDILFARESAKSIGINHQVIKISVLKDELISANTDLRCYHCKKTIINTIDQQPLFDGSHIDDTDDRPGLRAIREAGVISPLALAGFDKKKIIEAAKFLQLYSMPRPSNSCLATRIKTGTALTQQNLTIVELTEDCMFEAGAKWCRARIDENQFKIEYGAGSALDEDGIKIQIVKNLPTLFQMDIKFLKKT